MSESTRRYEYASTEREGPSLGTILFGLILVSLGVLWLLDVTGAVSVTWTFVSAVMLVLLGIALIVGARDGSHGGLVFLGLVLTAVVLIGSLATWPSIGTGIGEQEISPTSITEVEEQYRWGMGSGSFDFRNVEFPEGDTTIAVQLGMGDLEIRLPANLAVRIEYQVGAGEVRALDFERSGVGLDGVVQSEEFDEAERRLLLDVQVGLGAVEVRQ